MTQDHPAAIGQQTEYPVGRCTTALCYAEPHRHGFACDRHCACEGIGPTTAPIGDDDLPTCDWGHCDRESVALRLSRSMVDAVAPDRDGEVWLAVCRWHAGWDDYPNGVDHD